MLRLVFTATLAVGQGAASLSAEQQASCETLKSMVADKHEAFKDQAQYTLDGKVCARPA